LARAFRSWLPLKNGDTRSKRVSLICSVLNAWRKKVNKIFLLCGVISVIFMIMLSTLLSPGRERCQSIGTKNNVEARYSLFSGCEVKYSGEWLEIK
jgi:hypothetical protein